MKKFTITILIAFLAIIGLISMVCASNQDKKATAPVDLDDDYDGLGDLLEQFLAEKFAPVLFIEPGESNYPVNVNWILQRASLYYWEICFFFAVNEQVIPVIGSQANLLGPPWVHPDNWGQGHPESHCGYPPHHRRISTIAEDPDGEKITGYSNQTTFVIPDLTNADRVGSLDPREWVTYFHAYPTSEGGVMIQYWHTFAYNDFTTTLGNHGGDWDATIHIQLDDKLNLKGAWFPRHGDDKPGTFKTLTELTLYQGTHTVMTIDGGGHASFASPNDWWDFNTNGNHWGTVVWTDNIDDPGTLRKVDSWYFLSEYASYFLSIVVFPWGLAPIEQVGGTVWKTWTKGDVRQAGEVDHSLRPNPSKHGGLINLGEYNPCIPATCQGVRQASPLLAGEFHPLNGQIFIRYSGRWGSVGMWSITTGPRGPVFQGFDGNTYTSWYNQASNVPRNPGLFLNQTDGTVLLALKGEVYDGNVGPLCSTGVPYLVLGNVVVPAGKTLTVCPGVTLKFDTNAKIIAYGLLQANGHSGTIKFVSNAITTKGIRISSQFILKNGGELELK